MTALVFVDTNVLLYTHDERDLDKQSRAREWVTWCWRQRAGRISSQVLNEFYNNAITKFRQRVTVRGKGSDVWGWGTAYGRPEAPKAPGAGPAAPGAKS